MRRTSWPFLALTAVLLAGCSGDPEPKEPDASTTPDSTATPPPLPEAATQETAEGAAAFVDHYLDVLTYAGQTGETAPLGAISTADCEGCNDYLDHYTERANAGGRLEGGVFTAGPITLAPYGNEVSLTTEVTIAGGTVTETAASDPQSFDPTTEVVTFVASFSSGAWKMTQFVPGSQE